MALKRTYLTAGCAVAVVAVFTTPSSALAAPVASLYRNPPPAIANVLNAPPLPAYIVSPAHDAFIVATPLRYPPVADLARPMLRLAGIRIDPRTNGIHHVFSYTTLAIERVSDGHLQQIALPVGAHVTAVRFSPDGKRYAFTNASAHGTDLYVGTTFGAAPSRVAGVEVNDLFGGSVKWMPDGKHLLVRTVDRHGPPPAEPAVPAGPIVQEVSGRAGEIVTYEDLLANPHDEDLFDYYATSRLAIVDSSTLHVDPLQARGVFTSDSASPDGKYILTERVHRPYSYLFPFERFPTQTAVLDLHGSTVRTVADRPLQDRVPADGVSVGPRNVAWELDAPATLSWIEALDGGDPRRAVDERDQVVFTSVGSKSQPTVLMRTKQRIASVTWFAHDPRAFVREHDSSTRLTQTWLADRRAPGTAKTFGEPLRDGDVYHDPGAPVLEPAPNDQLAVVHAGNTIYLRGLGWGPDGRKPFVDRVDLGSGATARAYQSQLKPLDAVLAIEDTGATRLLLLRQSPTLPPNVYQHSAHGDVALTHTTDPTPIVRQIQRRVVTYKRPDGINLSFTLYLPPGYKEGTRLPTFLWAYPMEFNDASVASENTNSTQDFVTLGGASELFMALDGYAVLDNATIPIVGPNPRTVNDTYVEQLVAGAKAAIDEAAAIGVTDPNRVGVGGHSYGAFMTANLLAHTRLFRAGIARSGAYNRTLTPFGFQNERRTYWEATDLYTKMSPFTYASEIKDPLLMIHGMADDNTGTFPIQSERMFAAIQGNGGTARLVMLPNEAHGYVGKETIATVLAEMADWLDRFVKTASPPASSSTSTTTP